MAKAKDKPKKEKKKPKKDMLAVTLVAGAIEQAAIEARNEILHYAEKRYKSDNSRRPLRLLATDVHSLIRESFLDVIRQEMNGTKLDV